jgi:hypothetical protein
MKRIEIKSGDKYGRLTITEEIEPYITPSGVRHRKFNCLCDCGEKKSIVLKSLRNNHTISCGCFHKEVKTNHGLTGTYEYHIWNSMKQRCNNPKNISYKDYGGRGIKVCDRWLNSFNFFLEDMGKKPDGYSLDRINNDDGYKPTNCRWATMKEQSNNRRVVDKKNKKDIYL